LSARSSSSFSFSRVAHVTDRPVAALSSAVPSPTAAAGASNANVSARNNGFFGKAAGRAAASSGVGNRAVPKLKNGMDYVTIGDSDLVVSKVCMGTVSDADTM
jgi:hypothetical protein